jgi:hypothetical protein
MKYKVSVIYKNRHQGIRPCPNGEPGFESISGGMDFAEELSIEKLHEFIDDYHNGYIACDDGSKFIVEPQLVK